MKALFLIFLFGLMALSGCALLGFQSNSQNEDENLDPVEAIAKQLRASNEDSEEAMIRKETRERKIEVARHNGELTVGMPAQDVLALLGEPRDRETAGSSGLGYERWVYFDGLSSPWSMSTAHVIYFEQGNVVGWQNIQR